MVLPLKRVASETAFHKAAFWVPPSSSATSVTYLMVHLMGVGSFTLKVLYCVDSNLIDLEERIIRNLQLLSDYCEVNRRRINSGKTKYVVFNTPGSKNLNAILSLKIGDAPLGVHGMITLVSVWITH